MSSKRVAVGTSVSRAIPDDKLPNCVSTGLTRALFQDGNIPEYVLEQMIGSIGVKAERMYTYGRDHYTHGLPSGQFTVAAENIDEVVGSVLLSIEGEVVEIDYLRHGSPNNLHIGWLTLVQLYGYNPATNQLAGLTAYKGTPVYLDDLIVVIPDIETDNLAAQSLEQWGPGAQGGYTPERASMSPEIRAMVKPSPVRIDPAASEEYLRVQYVWLEAGVLMRDTFTMPVTSYGAPLNYDAPINYDAPVNYDAQAGYDAPINYDAQADYYQVRYRKSGLVKYWMYRDGAGTYPTLDGLFDTAHVPNGSFFPFAYFRFNHVSEIKDKTTEAYKTSKKLVSYLGMNYDLVAEAIDANPGIENVEQAMLMLAVPANTTNELELRYLWEFFNDLYLASSPDNRYFTEEEAALYAMGRDQIGLRAPGIVIQDTRFKMSLDNQGIYRRRKAGSIGPVGTHNSSVATRNITYTYLWQGESEQEVQAIFPVTSHYYRRQISTGFYDEIQVVELRTVFYIYERYTAIGDEEDTILMVPLDRAITSRMSIPEREILYARSLHYVFNSVVITTVKWYQSDLFQFVVIVIAIVVTILDWGSDGGSALSLALAAGSYAAAATIIIMTIVEALILRAAFKFVVRKLGVEAAFVIAIVAACLGLADAVHSGSVAGAPFASDLLLVSSGLTQAIGIQLQSGIQDLLRDAAETELLQKEQTKLLDEAKKLLENSSILSPFVIFGEKPDDFYNRTVHSGNIGVVGINAIPTYVDRALTLPTLRDSLGGENYAVS